MAIHTTTHYSFAPTNLTNQSNPLYCVNMLHPWFITGFSDGESCFLVMINKNNRHSTGYSLQISFQILLHKKDIALLEQIKSKWGVGVINDKPNNDAVNFSVSGLKDIQIVIDHFETYPLITKKLGDYKLFKQVFNMMKDQEHLTMEGLQKIVAIKSALNLGLPDKLTMAFSDIKYLERLIIVNQEIKDPYWLAGFASAEGCFFINIYKSKTKLGFAVKLIFKITQHSRDRILLENFVDYLGCGKYYKESNREKGEFRVDKFVDIEDKIIPFFKKYPISGIKALDFWDFCVWNS